MRPPEAELTYNERFTTELLILREYLLADADEIDYQVEWIRSCTGLDAEHFEPLIKNALDGLEELRRIRINPVDFVPTIDRKMQQLQLGELAPA